LESGEWRVESGELRVESGEWRVESGAGGGRRGLSTDILEAGARACVNAVNKLVYDLRKTRED